MANCIPSIKNLFSRKNKKSGKEKGKGKGNEKGIWKRRFWIRRHEGHSEKRDLTIVGSLSNISQEAAVKQELTDRAGTLAPKIDIYQKMQEPTGRNKPPVLQAATFEEAKLEPTSRDKLPKLQATEAKLEPTGRDKPPVLQAAEAKLEPTGRDKPLVLQDAMVEETQEVAVKWERAGHENAIFQKKREFASKWKETEIKSYDKRLVLKTDVFFASFDQFSDRVKGHGACSVLALTIADYMLSKPTAILSRADFDGLIIKGAKEWQRLWPMYHSVFPGGHFDLDTALTARTCNLKAIPDRSFAGFFTPPSSVAAQFIDYIEGSLTFDQIWSGIETVAQSSRAPVFYTVCFMDHFFLLRAERSNFYVVDTMGGRLNGKNDKAHIIKFSEKTSLSGNGISGQVSAKDACKIYIEIFVVNRLLADIKLEGLSLNRLQQLLQVELTCVEPKAIMPSHSDPMENLSGLDFQSEREPKASMPCCGSSSEGNHCGLAKSPIEASEKDNAAKDGFIDDYFDLPDYQFEKDESAKDGLRNEYYDCQSEKEKSTKDGFDEYYDCQSEKKDKSDGLLEESEVYLDCMPLPQHKDCSGDPQREIRGIACRVTCLMLSLLVLVHVLGMGKLEENSDTERLSPIPLYRTEKQVAPHFFSRKSPFQTHGKYILKLAGRPSFDVCPIIPISNRSLMVDKRTGNLQFVTVPFKSIDNLMPFDRPKRGMKADDFEAVRLVALCAKESLSWTRVTHANASICVLRKKAKRLKSKVYVECEIIHQQLGIRRMKLNMKQFAKSKTIFRKMCEQMCEIKCDTLPGQQAQTLLAHAPLDSNGQQAQALLVHARLN